MDVLAAIRAGTASVVVIDDLFAGPDLTRIPAANKHELADRIEANAEEKAAIQALLKSDGVDDETQLAELAAAQAVVLWGKYTQDPAAHPYLQPLFASFEAERAEIVRLRQLVGILTDAFGRAPHTFASLQESKEELSRCAIAFVDLFFGTRTIEQILELHAQYQAQYREEFPHADEAWPKLIVLMSTRMPGNEQLRSFRKGAGIRTAFFRLLPKNQIEAGQIDRILKSWALKYAAAAALNRYLNQLTAIVRDSAEWVVHELDQVEVHDLAVLDAARLLSDNASLHSYVSWLTSELLAARTRTNAARAINAPARAIDGAVDPMLVRESVLFDLFAAVTSMPAEKDGLPQFGEIIARVSDINASSVSVLIAISPACDLTRCKSDYEVLLLKGVMRSAGGTTAELLQTGAVFGKGKHLLKFMVGDVERQGVIEWDTKQGLTTRPAGDLSDAAIYVRVGRMAELFAYEVKELAISHLSRIGLPVAPSIQRAASVRVRARFDVRPGVPKLEFDETAPGEPTVCALVTMGRLGEGGSEAELVLLTEPFRLWFVESVMPRLQQGAGNTRVDTLIKNLSEWGEWSVQMNENSGKPGFESLTVKFVGETPDPGIKYLEILVSRT